MHILLLAGCAGTSEEDEVKQAFHDYVQAVKDKDGERFCDSIASTELAEMSRAERDKEIELCKHEFSAKDFGATPKEFDAPQLGEITVKGDRATAEVSVAVKDRKEPSEMRFLKVDGDWKVRFESR